MSSEPLISARNLGKTYRAYDHPLHALLARAFLLAELDDDLDLPGRSGPAPGEPRGESDPGEEDRSCPHPVPHRLAPARPVRPPTRGSAHPRATGPTRVSTRAP